MNLYLFNPDADLALADGGANYIPPASARQMAHDLALLPAWYARPGGGVLAPSAYNDKFLAHLSDLFGWEVRLVTEAELGEVEVERVMPWGWNLSVHRHLLRGGISERVLPDMAGLARWRALASRERVEEALKAFHHLPFCIGESRNLYTAEACRAYVEAGGRTVLKMPWSGSGKGLLWCSEGYTKAVEGWCMRVLRTQRCVVASPVHDKALDFALEFYRDGQGEVFFLGYSCFDTNARGAYSGNLLAPDRVLEAYLAGYVSLDHLHQVRKTAQEMLASVFDGYVGYVGIDMMVCRAGGAYVIHPCVEVNLRMNMGVVAGCLARRLLAPGSWGRFSIECFPSPEALRECHERDKAQAPLVVHDGRVSEGYLSLVPVTPSARYRAFVRVSLPCTEHSRFHNGLWP